jgi:Holliday junction resolvase
MVESKAHRDLKRKAVKWLKQEHGFQEKDIHKEYTIGRYLVDVVGKNKEKIVAVECGSLSGNRKDKQERVKYLKQKCDHYERYSFVRTDYTRKEGLALTRKEELKWKYGEKQ